MTKQKKNKKNDKFVAAYTYINCPCFFVTYFLPSYFLLHLALYFFPLLL